VVVLVVVLGVLVGGFVLMVRAVGRFAAVAPVGVDYVTAETGFRFPADTQVVGADRLFPWEELMVMVRVPSAELAVVKESCGCEWKASGDDAEMALREMSAGWEQEAKWWRTPHPRHFLAGFRTMTVPKSKRERKHWRSSWAVLDLDEPGMATVYIESDVTDWDDSGT
jgi:hypothetical protein